MSTVRIIISAAIIVLAALGAFLSARLGGTDFWAFPAALGFLLLEALAIGMLLSVRRR